MTDHHSDARAGQAEKGGRPAQEQPNTPRGRRYHNEGMVWLEPASSFTKIQWRGRVTVDGKVYRVEGRQIAYPDSDTGEAISLRFRLDEEPAGAETRR